MPGHHMPWPCLGEGVRGQAAVELDGSCVACCQLLTRASGALQARVAVQVGRSLCCIMAG